MAPDVNWLWDITHPFGVPVLPEVNWMYKGAEGETGGKVTSGRCSVTLSNLDCEMGMTVAEGATRAASRACACEATTSVALVCLKIVRSRPSGCAGSRRAKHFPTFITASSATLVHRDFSKSKGIMEQLPSSSATKF